MTGEIAMTPKRVAAWTLVGALAAAWFASAAGVIGTPRRSPRTPMRAQANAAADPISFDVHAQADRLRRRLATAPAPRPVRNPFVFAPRAPAPPRYVPRAVPPPPSAPVDVEPQMTLIGIAEEGAGEAGVRTAMIAGEGDQLFLVKVGQAVGVRYRVSAIGAEGVQLTDMTTGLVRRLVMR
jgi:hypothetical protein